MTLTPYLFFDGNCEDAVRFYADLFGGKVQALARISHAPMADQFPPGDQDKVMNVTLVLGDQRIMASDAVNAPYKRIEGVSLHMSFPEIARTRSVFDALCEGGEVTMAFEPTFWAAGFGTCRDRFGVPWMISCDPPPGEDAPSGH